MFAVIVEIGLVTVAAVVLVVVVVVVAVVVVVVLLVVALLDYRAVSFADAFVVGRLLLGLLLVPISSASKRSPQRLLTQPWIFLGLKDHALYSILPFLELSKPLLSPGGLFRVSLTSLETSSASLLASQSLHSLTSGKSLPIFSSSCNASRVLRRMKSKMRLKLMRYS